MIQIGTTGYDTEDGEAVVMDRGRVVEVMGCCCRISFAGLDLVADIADLKRL